MLTRKSNHTIRTSASPSAIAASQKPPPLKLIADNHSRNMFMFFVQPLLCIKHAAQLHKANLRIEIYT